MDRQRRAVIDVGTNSVKLLIGDLIGKSVVPVFETSDQTRLGHGFYESHILQPGAISQTAQAVANFVGEARKQNAVSIRTIATSAVRDAQNKKDLVEAIAASSGQTLRIITGDQEADYAYKGVLTDPKFAHGDLLLLDMGGGSTEFVLGRGGKKLFRHSFLLGALRLLDQMQLSDPPSAAEFAACRERIGDFLKAQVRPMLSAHLQSSSGNFDAEVQLVGTGGTAGIIARIEAKLPTYDRDVMEALTISREQLRHHMERLWALPLAERREVLGLPPRRADIVLPGIAAYVGIMDEFGFDTLRVSTRGLRFAVLMEH